MSLPAPPIEGVYFEKLNSILINTISPKCFSCGRLFVADEVCVSLKGNGGIIRLEKKCFDSLMVGLYLFNEHTEKMKTFSLEIQ